ncbi:MAG: choice-of-anchor V domain-containing protein [Gemmatimonadota bacterium]
MSSRSVGVGRADRRVRRGRGALASLFAIGVSVVALLLGAKGHPVYRDGPPPGFTGGFGEQSCHACHFDASINDPAGIFEVSGIPTVYEAGKRYPLVVTLTRPGMEAGGFQLTAREEQSGAQAGSLTADPADEARVRSIEDRDVEYLQQRLPGSGSSASDTLHWRVIWTAPEGSANVLFNAAANVADGDGSASGDFVYTAKVVTRSPP